MSLLLSSPWPSASWRWEAEFQEDVGVETAAATALTLAALLQDHELLQLQQVEVYWYVPKKRILRSSSLITLKTGVETPIGDLLQDISASRPSGYPDAFAGRLVLSGPGKWIDAQGHKHTEQQLSTAILSLHAEEIGVTLVVRHDIWSYYDFSGIPHPEIHARNAPRLTALLKAMEATLETDTIEGEPTHFAEPDENGIKIEEPDEYGRGHDSSMFL